MRGLTIIALASALQVGLLVAPVAAQTCTDAAGGLGVSRIVEIDASAGPLYGDMTKYTREDTFLGPKEVVLTFDDGPMPRITKSILDTLDRYCTKATFFAVGQMALAYPDVAKEVVARGHTLGGHTWSHPMNLARIPFETAKDQIERGFAAIAHAAGQPIAPFFRFPGLSDSDPLLAHLQTRGIASFTVDVVSNDSYIASPSRLTQRTLEQVERRNGGIMLFHDIKASTEKALPEILRQLQVRGYKVVHMRAKAPLTPMASYEPELAAKLAKTVSQNKPGAQAKLGTESTHQLRPILETAAVPLAMPTASPAPVTELAPVARVRAVTRDSEPRASHKFKRTAAADDDDGDRAVKPPKYKVRQRSSKKFPSAAGKSSETDKDAFFPQ